MNSDLRSDTLLIIPCCKNKVGGGQPMPSAYIDPMSERVSPQAYAEVLRARSSALSDIRSDTAFSRGDYSKNTALHAGPDFNGEIGEGRYMPASLRYKGTLYSAPGLCSAIDRGAGDVPHVLILSALYGPLHPASLIQDYNLKMGDRPSKVWSRTFTPFLDDYAKRNGIAKIRLYVGSETYYFKVAKAAAETLLSTRTIESAVQYHVVNGNSWRTPSLHGSRFVADLAGRLNDACCDPSHIEERYCGGPGKPWQTHAEGALR